MKKSLFILFVIMVAQLSVAQTYFVSTVVGNGTQGNINGPYASCELYWPYNVKSDNDSVLYFADTYNNCVKKLNINTNIVSLVAGTGASGYQNGIGSIALFNLPGGMFYKSGYLYLADCGNHVIRMIDLNNNNLVTTVAGTGALGFQNGSVSTAQFNNPFSVYVEANGDMYIADYGNHCIRFISGGQVSTFAGTPGTSGFTNGANNIAKFNLPRDLTKDANGDMYIADQSNHVIRKISSGLVSTFSGSGAQSTTDGSATTASYYFPTGICIGASGNFYVCEVGSKVRKVDPSGSVLSIAGTGANGFLDGSGATAQFNILAGICYDPRGYAYVSDKINNRIRKIYLADAADVASSAQKLTGLKIYPNPSSDYITIESMYETGSITISNTLGETVYQAVTNKGQTIVDIGNLARGFYYLQLKYIEGVVSQKMEVQR